jgi:hypothetical protein
VLSRNIQSDIESQNQILQKIARNIEDLRDLIKLEASKSGPSNNILGDIKWHMVLIIFQLIGIGTILMKGFNLKPSDLWFVPW